MEGNTDQKKIYCFVCGWKSILGKHLKGCERKFIAEEEKKLKQVKLACPLPPPQLQEVLKNDNCTEERINLYNEKALAKFRAESQPACKTCKRCFNSEAIKQHEAGCQVKPQTPASDGEGRPAFRRATSYDCSFRKPRVLTCAICGREFGLTSLKIHRPQCIEKFNNEQAKKEEWQRRELPLMEQHFLKMMEEKLEDWTAEQIDHFNEQANRIYRDKGLVKCSNCGRAFFVESLEKHRKNCRLINGNINKLEEPEKPKQQQLVGKPRTVMCHRCGREFGTASLKIHQPQCIEKFLNQQRKKPNKAEQRALPELPPEITEKYDMSTLSSWPNSTLEAYNSEVFDFYNKKALVPCPNCSRTFFPDSLAKHIKGCKSKESRSASAPKQLVEPKEPKELRKPKVLFCYICGRQFGMTSLKIHQAQCQQKYRIEQSKKDIDQRKDLPPIPQRYRQMVENDDWPQDNIEEFNNYMNELYKGTVLEKCYNCGRTFFAEALVKHAKMCVKKEASPAPSKQGGKSPSKPDQLHRMPSKKHVVQHIVEEEQNQQDTELGKTTSLEDLEKPFAKKGKKEDGIAPPEATPTTPGLKRKETRKQPLPKFTKAPSTTQLPPKMEQNGKGKDSERKLEKKDEVSTPNKLTDFKSPKSSTTLKSASSKNLFAKPPQTKQTKKEPKEPIATPAKSKQQEAPAPKIKQTQEQDPVIQRTGDPQILPSNGHMANDEYQGSNPTAPTAEPEPTAKEQIETKQQPSPAASTVAPPPAADCETVQLELHKCKFCQRKFEATRLAKHLGICPKRVAEVPAPAKKVEFSSAVVPEPAEVELEKCRKCHRRFAKDRIDKHYGVCKGNLEVEMPKPAVKAIPQPAKELEKAEQPEQQANLVACSKCNRKFKEDRLQKHESICKVEPKKLVPAKPDRQPDKLPTKQPPADKAIVTPRVPRQADKLPAIEQHRAPSPVEQPKEVVKLLTELKHKKKSPHEIESELEREMEQLRQTKARFKDSKKPAQKSKPDKAKVNRTTVQRSVNAPGPSQPSPKRDSVHFPEI